MARISLRVHDDVEEAVLEQELGALEAGRQRLPDGLLDDPWPGEPDQGVRLGDDHVAQHGEAGRHAAGGRVQQDRDVGQPGLAQPAQRRRGLGHLHQREDALLHARAARGGEDQRRDLPLERPLEHPGDLLAGDRAHRSAHELEHEDPQLDRDLLDARRAGAQGVGSAGRPPGRPQPIAVLLRIAEAERVDALDRPVRLDEAPRIDHQLDPAGRRQRKVVLALRADVVVLLQVSRQQGGPTGGALGEDPSRDAPFLLRKIVVAVLVVCTRPSCETGEYTERTAHGLLCCARAFWSLAQDSDARTAAPEVAGVLQTRAEGAMDYRSGRSAMVLYACSIPRRRCGVSWRAAAPARSSGR